MKLLDTPPPSLKERGEEWSHDKFEILTNNGKDCRDAQRNFTLQNKYFSIVSCINEENLSSENSLQTFQLNTPLLPAFNVSKLFDWSILSKHRQLIF